MDLTSVDLATGVGGALVDVGFILCLVALLVFLIRQFRRTGRGD